MCIGLLRMISFSLSCGSPSLIRIGKIGDGEGHLGEIFKSNRLWRRCEVYTVCTVRRVFEKMLQRKIIALAGPYAKWYVLCVRYHYVVYH
jgi:hypothetical protein